MAGADGEEGDLLDVHGETFDEHVEGRLTPCCTCRRWPCRSWSPWGCSWRCCPGRRRWPAPGGWGTCAGGEAGPGSRHMYLPRWLHTPQSSPVCQETLEDHGGGS